MRIENDIQALNPSLNPYVDGKEPIPEQSENGMQNHDELIQRMTDEFYRIKSSPVMKAEFMVQHLFIDECNSEGYESAVKYYKPVLEMLEEIQVGWEKIRLSWKKRMPNLRLQKQK